MVDDTSNTPNDNGPVADSAAEPVAPEKQPAGSPAREIGGRGGLDPTRYGDWEKAGRCIDF